VKLTPGKVAVVTGAASGIGLALAERFGRAGMHVALADVDESALVAAAERVGALGVETLAVRTDVSDEEDVQRLAGAAIERFGAVHVVCNNAGVAARSDPWFGPLSAWSWVMGVNFWGVVHGVRAFLPILATQSEGHVVNTASMAGLLPGFGPAYDASKHAVVAITDDLYGMLQSAGLPVGVSVLCPGWVRTQIMNADRNWLHRLGEQPERNPISEVVVKHAERAIDEGTPPAVIADLVADAIEDDRFWVIPHDDFLELAVRRWHTIAERANPELAVNVPGLPPTEQLLQELQALMAPPQ
jgi:NAD(P)-dependent dehydrogenase (short-subunit alcohol dehydrogenase family)